MGRPLTIPGFGRVVSALNGKAKLHQPFWMLNFAARDSKLKFRYGYNPIQPSPVTSGEVFQSLGFGFVQNLSGQAEFVGVEDRDGTINVYRYDKDTLARTLVGAEEMASGAWIITSYADNAYLINPGGTKTVFRHVIFDNASLVALQDTDYTPEASDPDIDIVRAPLGRVAFDTVADAFVFTADNTITTPTKAASGTGYAVSGDANDNGPSSPMGVTNQVTFGTAKDCSDSDYIAIVIDKGEQFDDIKNDNFKPQLKIGVSWVDVVDYKEYRSTNGDSCTLVCYVKGMSGLNAVAGINFRVTTTHVAYRDAANRVAFTVQAIYLGGVYLEAEDSAKRLWDSDAGGDGVKYGVRFSDGVSTYSSIFETVVTSPEALGFYPSEYSCPLGGRLYISSTNAPETPFDRVEVLRLTHDGADWKIVGTATASPYTKLDPFCEYELAGQATADDTDGGTVPTPTPVFRTAGIIGAFPFKKFMIWLVSGGLSNIQMSRVGNAEELYDSAADYSTYGNAQPAQQTLADNADDEPWWGTQVGDVAFVTGKKAAYASFGDFPSTMSPFRQIPGSRGIVGPFAGVRFRSPGGQYSAAYSDPDFNIWLISSAPSFSGDARSKPQELSLDVRGRIKAFLYDEQQLINPDLDKVQTQLEFDEEDSSLWVILGTRAAIYRQDSNEDGWEFADYSLRTEQGESESTTCGDYSGNGGVAESVSPGDAAWTNFGYPFDSDDAYCGSDTVPLGSGKKTERLRLTGFIPPVLIPASAVMMSLKFQVERSQTGDLPLTETLVQPRKAGVDLGANLSTNTILTHTDQEEEFEIGGTLPTAAEINAGDLGIDLQYSGIESHADWNDGSKFSIAIPDDSLAAMVVNVTYTGALPKPPFVYVVIESTTTTSLVPAFENPEYSPGFGNGTSDNGLDVVQSGALGDLPDYKVIATGTKRVKIALVAGVGSYTVTRTSSGTSFTPGYTTFGEYEGDATFSPFALPAARVDSVRLKPCYMVSSVDVPVWVGWDQSCFTHDGRRVAIRSTGEIDLVEKDFRNGAFIDGNNRDGGYTPPLAVWESQTISFNGGTAKFSGCQVNSVDFAPSVYSQVAKDGWVTGFSTGYSTSHWFRFPLSQRGIQHRFKLTSPETTGAIDALSFEFDQTSQSKVR